MKKQPIPKPTVMPPAVDGLFISTDTAIARQAGLRRRLLASIEAFLQDDSTPTEQIRIELYDSLSAFLQSDPYDKRILLYLPFEFLPDANEHFMSPALTIAAKQFISIYMERWHELLSVHDVRATFVDGDIMETDIPAYSFPRVSKAAHFIPMLLQKHFVTMDEVIVLFTESDDDILRESITDSVPALRSQIAAIQKTNQQKRDELTQPSEARLDWERRRHEEIHAEHLFDESDLMKESHLLAAMATSIQSHEFLKQYVYPVALLYGSKVKGYASKDADTDIAIFIRPDTDFALRKGIQHALKEVFTVESIHGKALEFWLEHRGDGLAIEDFADPDQQLGDSLLTNVIFEGIWCGEHAAVAELQDAILPSYLHSKNRDARKAWLEVMERDTLQYRLLHKGYNRLHQPNIDPLWETFPLVDPGTFWDTGYREMATMLYLKKVFLPQLEK